MQLSGGGLEAEALDNPGGGLRNGRGIAGGSFGVGHPRGARGNKSGSHYDEGGTVGTLQKKAGGHPGTGSARGHSVPRPGRQTMGRMEPAGE